MDAGKEREMAYFLVQVTYTPEAWATMLDKPYMPLEGLRPLLEQLGGRLDSGWLAGGEYDAVLICQLPDQAGAAALSMAAAAAGAVKTIKTTPLMTVEESLDALQRAAAVHSQTSGRTPAAAGLPVPRSKPVAYKDIFSSRLQQIKERMGKIVTGR
jgi:uncharacterized protein with GYD domain